MPGSRSAPPMADKPSESPTPFVAIERWYRLPDGRPFVVRCVNAYLCPYNPAGCACIRLARGIKLADPN